VVRPQLVALASLVAGCSLVSGAASLSIEDGPPIADSLDSSASEAGTEPDANVDPGPFAVAIDPDRITSAENAKTSVEVTVHRSRAATGSIDVSVSGLPPSVTASSISIPPGASAGTLSISVTTAPASEITNLTVHAVSGAESATAPLVLVVTPNLFATTASGPAQYTVPAGHTKLEVHAWGAGTRRGTAPPVEEAARPKRSSMSRRGT
jgi:hypothetical protein